MKALQNSPKVLRNPEKLKSFFFFFKAWPPSIFFQFTRWDFKGFHKTKCGGGFSGRRGACNSLTQEKKNMKIAQNWSHILPRRSSCLHLQIKCFCWIRSWGMQTRLCINCARHRLGWQGVRLTEQDTKRKSSQQITHTWIYFRFSQLYLYYCISFDETLIFHLISASWQVAGENSYIMVTQYYQFHYRCNVSVRNQLLI